MSWHQFFAEESNCTIQSIELYYDWEPFQNEKAAKILTAPVFTELFFCAGVFFVPLFDSFFCFGRKNPLQIQ